MPNRTSKAGGKSSLRFATPAYPDIVSDCQNIFVAFWVCPTPCFVSVSLSLGLSLCVVLFLFSLRSMPCFVSKVQSASRISVWIHSTSGTRSSVCLLLLPQFMMRTAFHFRQFIFCGPFPLTVMVGSVASCQLVQGPSDGMVRFLISDRTLGSCYAALS